MPPTPHPHGGGEEEEEIIEVRTDGPPFFEMKAKQGKGFEGDYEKLQKYLGPGKISASEFARDMAAINATYIPSANKSGKYLKIATNLLLGSFGVLILMGILGEFVETATRQTIQMLGVAAFLIGIACFLGSKWIEQPGIRLGADAVKSLLDNTINPAYERNPYKIRYAIAVTVQKKKAIHAGKAFVDRPVITIWALRSANSAGVVVDWPVPETLLSQVYVEQSDLKVVGAPR